MSDYTHKITMRIIKVIKYSLIVTSFVVMLTTKGQCCGNAYLTNYYLDVKKINNQIDSFLFHFFTSIRVVFKSGSLSYTMQIRKNANTTDIKSCFFISDGHLVVSKYLLEFIPSSVVPGILFYQFS